MHDTFSRCGLDHLLLGDWLISKKNRMKFWKPKYLIRLDDASHFSNEKVE